MKRDYDLLRDLLFEFEAADDFLILEAESKGMSKAERIRSGHVRLLCDAGLVASVGSGTIRLTNFGHDYIEVIRNEDTWGKIKEVASKAGGATLEMLLSFGMAILKEKASEYLGTPR